MNRIKPKFRCNRNVSDSHVYCDVSTHSCEQELHLLQQQYFGDMKMLRRENKMLAKQLDELVTKDAVEV